MDGYEVRQLVSSIVGMLGEILAEVKGLREDFAEGQAVLNATDQHPHPFGSVITYKLKGNYAE